MTRAARTDEERCAQYRRYARVDAAFRAGDLDALLGALDADESPDFPNGYGPWGLRCSVLHYAIDHSPLAFVRTLLELGADPNYDDGDGFPALVAALAAKPAPEHRYAGRDDVYELMELLLSFGADVGRLGVNGYSALHRAAADGDVRAVRLLLAHGADPSMRTNVDDYETPLEIAERNGRAEVVELFRDASR